MSSTSKYKLEYPSAEYLEQQMIEEFAQQIIHRYHPQYKNRSIEFYADKKFLNKKAYEAIKIDDIERAFEYAKRSVELAESGDKVKSRHLAKAHYNLGVVHFLKDEYDIASDIIRNAVSIKANKDFRVALGIISEVQGNEESVAYWEESAIVVGGDAAPGASNDRSVHEPASPSGQHGEVSQDELVAKIKKYKKLLDQGLISQDVYDRKTAPLIEQLDF